MDNQIGRLRNMLTSYGVRDNTAVPSPAAQVC
jgi:hypothetical protein